MAKNQESINRSLFELLRSRGYAPTLLDTSGKEIPVPEEAEVFQFKFSKDGKEYGTVTASIDGLHKLVIYFGDDVANSEKETSTSGDDSWYKLLNHLKRFAQQHQLSFEVKNRDHLKYDMAKREHMKKQERISEGYYPMGKKASYNDNIPTIKIVIEHSRQIEEGEQRYRNVNRIFLAEGGLPHDDRWNHIVGLCEEYNKMGAFVRATRNNQFNESAQQLVNEGINHYQSLKESLSKMRGARGYNAYFESYTPPLMEDETEENNLNELFVQETLDPRIESVMPILSKLHKKVAEMKEVNELSEWADNLIDEGAAVDAYMAGKSPALAHFADQLDKEVDEGMFDKVKDVVKTGAKALDKFVTGGDKEDLLKDLKDKAGVRNPENGKPSMAYSDVEKRTDEVDMGQADSSLRNEPKQNNDKMDHFTALGKASKKMGHNHFMDVPDDKLEALKAMVKKFRSGEEVDESALQASFGIKKYGEPGMLALQDAGRKGASEKTKQNIRAEFSDKEKPVTEGQEELDFIKHLIRK